MNTKTKHVTVLLAALFVLLAMVYVNADIAFAQGQTALTVYDGTKVKKSYTMDQINALGKEVYQYSVYNTVPTHSEVTDAEGPTIKSILDKAGINLDRLTADTVISFQSGSDKRKVSLTVQQLTEPRFYFPHGEEQTAEGKAGDQSSQGDKEKVQAIINTRDSSDKELCLGQVAPNEQTKPLFNKGMVEGGKITVEKTKAARTDNDLEYLNKEGRNLDQKFFSPGDVIKLDSKSKLLDTAAVYYTIDGDNPSAVSSDIYNYSRKNRRSIELTAAADPGLHKIKFQAVEYGKKPSNLRTLLYYVGQIEVYEGQNHKKTVSASRLKDLSEPGYHNYSTYNNMGNFHNREKQAYGPSVESILQEAGLSLKNMPDDQVIRFTSEDGYYMRMTKAQIIAKRYFYPNGKNGTANGAKGTAASRSGAKSVPMIVNLDNGRLCLGQQEPNEQTYPLFIDTVALGSITVESEKAKQLAPVAFSTTAKTLTWGSSISFKTMPKGEKIYYTVNGSNPSFACDIYNYDTYSNVKRNRSIKIPAGATSYTVKAFSTEYGKKNSPVRTITYQVVPPKAGGLKVKAGDYRSAKVSWSKMTGANGYAIYRATSKNGKYSKIKTITSPSTVSYTNTGLKTGRYYYYKVAAYKKAGTKTLLGTASSPASVKTSLSKPSFKLTAKKKAVQVKWKKTSGASGYVVYQASSKKGKYKAIYTNRSSKAGTYTKKKLRSKKTYYYKMRAYRTVDGKRVYSGYTSMKAKKTK